LRDSSSSVGARTPASAASRATKSWYTTGDAADRVNRSLDVPCGTAGGGGSGGHDTGPQNLTVAIPGDERDASDTDADAKLGVRDRH
jgi:hypothetical protein